MRTKTRGVDLLESALRTMPVAVGEVHVADRDIGSRGLRATWGRGGASAMRAGLGDRRSFRR